MLRIKSGGGCLLGWFSILAIGVFISIFSLSSAASADTKSTGQSTINVSLANLVALRILDSTASTEISGLDIALTPTPNGEFNKNSMMVEVSTRNSTGYKLYMRSIGEDSTSTETTPVYTTALVYEDSGVLTDAGRIPALPASATNVTEADYRVRNSLYKNTWGFSLNGYTVIQTEDENATGGVSNTITENTNTSTITYSTIPEYNSNVMIHETNAQSTKDLTPVTIGVNSTSANASGVYKNTLEYTATANPIPADYSLTFAGNAGSDTVSNMPSPNPMTASSVSSSYTFTVPSTIPSRAGYTFTGWNTEADGSGAAYSAGDSFVIVADDTDPSSTAKTLYATWKPAFFSISQMQQMTTAICNAATTPTKDATAADTTGVHVGNTSYYPQKTLVDTRNNTSYVVRKLADGNCWMSSNLKLSLTSGTAITAADFSGGTVSWTPNANTTSDSGNAYNVAINGNYKANANGGNWYYPWYAATAGQGTQTASPTINRSICPKGWRLPDGNTSSTKSFYNLITAAYSLPSSEAGIASLKAVPLSFVATGGYSSGVLVCSSCGYYWSATPKTSDANNAYHSYFNASGIIPEGNSSKSAGFSVRCVSS